MPRITRLDTLRGMAALAVFFQHCSDIWPDHHGFTWWLLTVTPLHFLWAGQEAVLFFFLLSGFVLSRGLFGGSRSYPGFLVRRVLRIYPAAWLAIIAGAVASLHFFGQLDSRLSGWYAQQWAIPFSWDQLFRHLALVLPFNIGAFDPPIWSLVHEMRISLLMPVIALAVSRRQGGRLLAWSMGVGFIAFFLAPFTQAWTATVYLISFFVFGSLLAFHAVRLTGWVSSLSSARRTALPVLGLVLYCNWWYTPGITSLLLHPVSQWLAGLGAAAILIWALAQERSWLDHGALAILGKASYSFYLFHFVVLLSLVHLLSHQLPLLAIYPIALAVSVAISLASYHLVERPAVALGRRVGGRLAGPRLEISKLPA